MRVPTPGLVVRRAAPEGVGVKSTTGRRSRPVPLANRVLPLVLAMTEGKEPGDLLFTTQRGAQLHRTSVLRAVDWRTTGQGRRIHDLRHTAACLWLARSVDPGTVQAWMGHESIATTNLYLHFLGTSAHRSGLDRLNLPRGAAGGPAERPLGDLP
jgi:integrase